jgi:hypothetical protein
MTSTCCTSGPPWSSGSIVSIRCQSTTPSPSPSVSSVEPTKKPSASNARVVGTEAPVGWNVSMMPVSVPFRSYVYVMRVDLEEGSRASNSEVITVFLSNVRFRRSSISSVPSIPMSTVCVDRTALPRWSYCVVPTDRWSGVPSPSQSVSTTLVVTAFLTAVSVAVGGVADRRGLIGCAVVVEVLHEDVDDREGGGAGDGRRCGGRRDGHRDGGGKVGGRADGRRSKEGGAKGIASDASIACRVQRGHAVRVFRHRPDAVDR